MTIKELLLEITKKLEGAGIEFARNEADMIICFVLGKKKDFLILNPDFVINEESLRRIESFVDRRTKNEPLAYIFGTKGFYGLDFEVNKNCLVPRPETEMIIDDCLMNDDENVLYVDLGTGSGCIIITLAKLLKNAEKCGFLGVDISREAFMLAQRNAKKNGVEGCVNFKNGDLLELVLGDLSILKDRESLVIAANLPYLTPEQVDNSPSIQMEPRLALVAGSDGLKYYREMFKQVVRIKKNNDDLRIRIYCEIDDSQGESIVDLIKKELGDVVFRVDKDLRGFRRMVVIEV